MDIFAKNTKICLCKCVGIGRHLRKRNMREREREREREITCPEIKIIIAKLLSMWQSVLTKFL